MKCEVKISEFCQHIGFEKCIKMNGMILDSDLKKDKKLFPPYHTSCECFAKQLPFAERKLLRINEAIAEMKRRGTFYVRRLQ